MKKYLILLYACLLFLLFPQVIIAENNSEARVIDAFLKTTQSGNTTNIFSMLTDPLRSRMKTLLLENKEYKKILQKKYSKARFNLDRVFTLPDESKVAEVSIYYADGSKSRHKFLLKEVSARNWKISDEIFD